MTAERAARRGRMREVLAAHGRITVDDIDQVLDELETAIEGAIA